MTITRTQLLDFDPATDVVARNREMRSMSRQRLNMSQDQLADLLGVDFGTVIALECGSLDVSVSPYDGTRHLIPVSTMNSATAKTVALYHRFLRAAETLAEVAYVDHLDAPGATMVQGDANLSTVAWLRDSVGRGALDALCSRRHGRAVQVALVPDQ